MRNLILIALISVSSMAFLTPKNSKLETSFAQQKDNKLSFAFKVVPNKGIQITDIGPWELKLTDTEGLNLPLQNNSFVLKPKDFDKSYGGFKFETGKPSKKNGTLKYRLKAFVCTDDKTRCFPEIHKGTLDWSTDKK